MTDRIPSHEQAGHDQEAQATAARVGDGADLGTDEFDKLTYRERTHLHATAPARYAELRQQSERDRELRTIRERR